MAIIIDKDTKTVIQGMTGQNASLHTRFMLDYGTKIVGGVTPGKAGQEVEGIPVYDTVKACLSEHPDATVSSIWVPARFAKDAILEAIYAGIQSIIVITERIPVHDMLQGDCREPWPVRRLLQPSAGRGLFLIDVARMAIETPECFRIRVARHVRLHCVHIHPDTFIRPRSR